MNLLVLGNAGLDLGLALPHLPREGETVVGRGMPSAPGGKGLNQAVVAARTGLVPVTLMAASASRSAALRSVVLRVSAGSFAAGVWAVAMPMESVSIAASACLRVNVEAAMTLRSPAVACWSVVRVSHVGAGAG